jgi:hypothetical protein
MVLGGLQDMVLGGLQDMVLGGLQDMVLGGLQDMVLGGLQDKTVVRTRSNRLSCPKGRCPLGNPLERIDK